ncbi:uncharacterized protein F4812DRAFT_470295 [Daldinia caldariorum]|uniref:uncharacterized protein n=1 Tax=Daldinia caldariorum TaxID=326644 RepID=UPI002008D3B5|nr:uncharacterized protein F4812DRAFT_470295 [Daldinia caldariorum]KAI1469275.1 hypothetical protein F4812DRAFT_470295 [Daldinia caldariorum]
MGRSSSPQSLKMRFPRYIALSTPVFLYIFAVGCLWGHLYRNGYLDALLRLKNEGPHHLPGSENAIRTFYTGIGPLDKLVTVGVVIFANVTDGSTPELSLYIFQFCGQYLAMLVMINIESLRAGNATNFFSLFSLWGFFMQITSYGCTMPLYVAAHLLNLPTGDVAGVGLSEAVPISKLSELAVLPQAFILGYVIPATLMSVPIFSNATHQWFVGLWQGFHIFIVLFQKLLAAWVGQNRRLLDVDKRQKCPPDIPTKFQDSSACRNEKDLLEKAYLFAFSWCLVSHVVTFMLIAAVCIAPSTFPPHLREAWTISKVFLPTPFWSSEKMESMATAMHSFFAYDQYVGLIASIIWSSALYVKSRELPMGARAWAKLGFTVSALTLCSGHAGAVVWLMWKKDQRLLSRREKGEELGAAFSLARTLPWVILVLLLEIPLLAELDMDHMEDTCGWCFQRGATEWAYRDQEVCSLLSMPLSVRAVINLLSRLKDSIDIEKEHIIDILKVWPAAKKYDDFHMLANAAWTYVGKPSFDVGSLLDFGDYGRGFDPLICSANHSCTLTWYASVTSRARCCVHRDRFKKGEEIPFMSYTETTNPFWLRQEHLGELCFHLTLFQAYELSGFS